MGLRHNDFMALFDQWAATYDQTVLSEVPADGFEDYARVLERVAGLAVVRPGVSVTDVGTGTGNLALVLSETGATVTAVEPSAQMRQVAAEKLRGAAVVDGTFLALPVADRSQDAVVSTYAFHHLTDEQKVAAAGEMLRVLKPGGRIVLGDYAWANPEARSEAIRRFTALGRQDLVDEIREEYYPMIGHLVTIFAAQGCSVYLEQVNDWVWILAAQKGRGH